MRILLATFLLMACTTSAAAQEQTLFKGDVETSGFGGPVVKFTRINDQGSIMVGGRGGWLIGHSLALGGGGYGLVNDIDAPPGVLPVEGPLDIKFGYGGFELEYIVHPNSLGHFSVGTLIGGGATNFVRDVGPVTESNEQVGESDVVVVFEPALKAELNVTTWFRLNAGVSYRFVTGVRQGALRNRDFSGIAAAVTFKFGGF